MTCPVSGDYIFTDSTVLERVPYVWLLLAGMVFILLLPGLIFITPEEETSEEDVDHACKESKLRADDDYEELMPWQGYKAATPICILGKHDLQKL